MTRYILLLSEIILADLSNEPHEPGLITRTIALAKGDERFSLHIKQVAEF